jgi:F-type H+-transporting ATPase subunit alpha
VIAIYACTPQKDRDSWVRELELKDISRYEEELLAYLRAEHASILGEIRDTGVLSDETKASLGGALDAFGGIFQPTKKVVEAA